MRRFVAEDLIFLDKLIFNEKTGWRLHAYAPISDETRYDADIRRGRTWSICAAMTLNGWLPIDASTYYSLSQSPYSQHEGDQ